MRVTVAGWEFTIGPVQAVVLGVLLLFAVWLALKILGLIGAVIRFLNGDETAISRYFDRNRERKGYRALSEAMLALASGEPRQALSRAHTAERLLGKPEITTLLVAQAAEAAMTTNMPFQSRTAWASSDIQATPRKASPMPARANFDRRSPRMR